MQDPLDTQEDPKQDPPDIIIYYTQTHEDLKQDPPDTGVCIAMQDPPDTGVYAESCGHTGGSQAGSSGHRCIYIIIHTHTQE